MLSAPIVEIFVDIDDFCKSYEGNKLVKSLEIDGVKKRNRSTELALSEMMTIFILFHMSHYRTFKDFFLHCVLTDLSSSFPKAVSYHRFVALTPRVLEPLTA